MYDFHHCQISGSTRLACEAVLVLFQQSFRCMWIFQSEELHYHRYKWRVHQHLNRKTVQIAWHALKWMLTAKVMLDIIPSPQGRLLLTRSLLCCVSKVTACKWQNCIRHRTLTLIYRVCFIWHDLLTGFASLYILMMVEWVLVALQARLGRLSSLALEKSQFGPEMWCFNAKWTTFVHRWPLFEGWQCTLYSNRCWYPITQLIESPVKSSRYSWSNLKVGQCNSLLLSVILMTWSWLIYNRYLFPLNVFYSFLYQANQPFTYWN